MGRREIIAEKVRALLEQQGATIVEETVTSRGHHKVVWQVGDRRGVEVFAQKSKGARTLENTLAMVRRHLRMTR